MKLLIAFREITITVAHWILILLGLLHLFKDPFVIVETPQVENRIFLEGIEIEEDESTAKIKKDIKRPFL